MTDCFRIRTLTVMEPIKSVKPGDPTWECETDCIPDLDLHGLLCLAYINDKRLEPTC